MKKPVIYDTINRLFRFRSNDDMPEGLFNVYSVKTNLKVGVLDAEMASFRFTDSESSLTSHELMDLIQSARQIQPNYQDV